MSDTTILQNSTHVIKPKKSVALSGVPAGNTALCTVGKSGNDLHYRGYDILDLAEHCEFEEVAHLLIHGKLPTRDELAAYKTKLKALRGLPANVRTVLEALPAASHPMDVMRTGVSALGCTLPEKEGHTVSGARDIADKLLASLSSILLYWYHYSHNGERIQPVKRRTKNAKAFHDKCENFSFRASNETAVLITAFYSLHGDHLGYG